MSSFLILPDQKKSRLGPQKVKNDPKIETKSNVRIEGNLDKKNCCTL